MFSNVMFNAPTIPPMQPSMVYLYKVASEKRQVNTPAAVGRVMKVSQQRLKNWENRGISKEGALLAQSIFGIDSNTLLAMNTLFIPEPFAYHKDPDKTLAISRIEEKRPTKYVAEWPFSKITIEQWHSLTPKQKSAIEAVAESYLTTVDPPLHNEPPAYKAASA